nr:DNA polymerase catalytic subunit [Human alphaherpesvirus 1]
MFSGGGGPLSPGGKSAARAASGFFAPAGPRGAGRGPPPCLRQNFYNPYLAPVGDATEADRANPAPYVL